MCGRRPRQCDPRNVARLVVLCSAPFSASPSDFFFAHCSTSAGAGLIWGLGAALLLWLILPVGILPLLSGAARPMAQLTDARDHFPELVAYLTCLGMPVGVALGIRGSRRNSLEKSPFHWWRAIIVGGFAGIIGGLIFGRWSSAGDFFPLIAGLGGLNSSRRHRGPPVRCGDVHRRQFRPAFPARCPGLRFIHGLGSRVCDLLVVLGPAHTFSARLRVEIGLVGGSW